MRISNKSARAFGTARLDGVYPEYVAQAENMISTIVDALSLRELLASNDRQKYDTLIEALKNPMGLDETYEVASRCLEELNSFQESGPFGEMVCLINSDTGELRAHCHKRSACHIALMQSSANEPLILGASPNGIFVRHFDIIGPLGYEVLDPVGPYLSEINEVNGNDHNVSHLDARRSTCFRSMAVEQTKLEGGGFEIRDLKTGKTFTGSTGYLSFAVDDYYPRHLKITEDQAEAADYEVIITWLRMQFKTALRKRSKVRRTRR
jgi:hypothetical protein